MTPQARVRVMLQSLGPTYVKIGQMVASRGEALPPEWLAELQQLQSDVAPFPWEEARDDDPQGAGQASRGAVRDHRDRAVRGGLDRPGPSGDAPRRHARGGQGPAAEHRGQDQGRPGRDAGAGQGHRRPRRSSPAASTSRASCTSSRAASSTSWTIATRPTTPAASPTTWSSSPASTCRWCTGRCRASAS